uniref:Reverse transcriptase domain-containing protein n=1 Tax=Tanacetum cinerariifolium TaxID=118510 RepID=A0A699L2B3_TANCI|nr:reverse transcriptase domain-containing protein [Tanacetum cinerariifolium]
MAELLRAPTKGYAEAIVVPSILAEQFELKHSLINMMTMDQFFGLEKDNPHDHICWFNKITSTTKYRDVPNSVTKLILFPFSLTRAARRWLEKKPSRSINTWEDLLLKFINEFFPPLRTTSLRNEISIFQQKFDESFHEAWDRYKDLLHACPHNGFTELHQLNTFYNALNPANQDYLNAAAGGNLLERSTQDVLTIIENKSTVRNSRSKPLVSQVKACDDNSNSEIAKLTHVVNQQTSAVTTAMTAMLKQFQATPPPASVKVIEEIYVTCGGAHPYHQCLATGGNTFLEFGDNIQGYVSAAAVNYNQVANPKGDLKAITTRSGVSYDGPSIPPSVVQSKPVTSEPANTPVSASKPNSKASIPYPSRRMMKGIFASTLKSLIGNKENLSEMARNPLNEHCSAVLLKKLHEKLGDLGKFLIPCDFPGMAKCLALADLGASINLMPYSVWKKLSQPELTPTCMTLELADRSISRPVGVAEDVYVKVGSFHFLTDFIVVDFDADHFLRPKEL